MGVYIKGISKPKCCGLCALYVAPSGTCPATKNTDKTERFSKAHRELEDDMWECTPEWCPLVEVKEPHGRLIDADVVLSNIGAFADHPNETLVNDLAIAFDIVLDAPTVIESESE